MRRDNRLPVSSTFIYLHPSFWETIYQWREWFYVKFQLLICSCNYLHYCKDILHIDNVPICNFHSSSKVLQKFFLKKTLSLSLHLSAMPSTSMPSTSIKNGSLCATFRLLARKNYKKCKELSYQKSFRQTFQ